MQSCEVPSILRLFQFDGRALLDPFAPFAPSHRLWLTVSGLVEKDVLCAIMTISAEVDLGSL